MACPAADVALVGAFGDLFFETSDGIVMLDMLEGTLRVVAKDHEALFGSSETMTTGMSFSAMCGLPTRNEARSAAVAGQLVLLAGVLREVEVGWSPRSA